MAALDLDLDPDLDLGEDVAWDLAPLVDGAGPEGVDTLLDRADALGADVQVYRGRVAGLDVAGLTALFELLASVTDLLERAGTFASLRFSTDTADPAVGAAMAKFQERATAIGTQLLFVDLEWAAVDDTHAEQMAAAPQLGFCAHHLRMLRRYRPHLLSEPEEKILAEKGITGAAAWSRLFDELLSSLKVDLGEAEPVSFEVALSRLQHPDRAVRQQSARAFTAALEPGLRTRTYIYNTLLSDKSIDDRLRHYPTWVSSRNLSNQASDESVQALVEAVTARNELARRWYRLKARILGLDRLADYDRNASIAPPGEANAKPVPFGEARRIVLDAYASFSPELSSIAQRFFDEHWIDAPLRPAKQGGAFCAPGTPNLHPYVLLNYTGTRHDVLTVAHELGHGVHFALARRQSIFHHMVPLTFAETASVFGETLTFNRLLEMEDDPHGRLALLAENMEGAIATVFRQVAMWRFEDLAHRARREQGELATEQLNEFWAQTQTELLGDSVEITPDYRAWWSYIPHFVHTPGYVYAYAFGQLLAMSVYQRYTQEGEGFVPRYLDLLSRGGSDTPERLAAVVDCDLSDPGFWSAGLDLVERTLNEAEAAAKAAGRIP